jgi:dipeptidyl aminopeptidase/acylaminoacyl peptidase
LNLEKRMSIAEQRVTTTDIEFESGGTTVRGTLYLPADIPATGLPGVVMAGGWCYVKELVLPHYATAIAERGIAVLAFDYRTFGASDGAPRLHIDPWAQIEDYRNGIDYLGDRDEVDAERIGIWGISYSGGHVLILGALDDRVKAIVSTIPVVEGDINMRRAHGEARYFELRELIKKDRRSRYEGSPPGLIPFHVEDPTKELSTWPYADSLPVFTKLKKNGAPSFENYSTIESVEMMLAYTVFPYVKRITRTPTMMVLTENDYKTLVDLEIEAFNQIQSPTKECAILPSLNHTSLYEDARHTRTAAAPAAEWFERHLAGRA